MSCRKRCIASTSATELPQTKRAKLLSDLWRSRDDRNSCDRAEEDQESEFAIRAIIGEKPGEYFIDWADNPLTGESYSPDWQPKRNVSIEAIAAWENQKIVQHSKKTLGKRRRRRSSTLSVTIHYSPTPRSKKKRSRHSRRGAKQRLDCQTVRNIQIHPPVTSTVPAVTVVVSQHSSLDHDQYILYHSSLSTSASVSLPQHYDSGIGESSPEPQVHHYPEHRIIPDSQPTSTTSIHATSSAVSSKSRSNSVPAPSIPYSIELPQSLGSLGGRYLQQLWATQERSISTSRIIPDSLASETTQSVNTAGKDDVNRSLPFDSHQVKSPQPFAQATGLLDLESGSKYLLDTTNGYSAYKRLSIQSQGFVIAEDEEDDTSTTRDTSGSIVLTQKNVNPQSQERSPDKEGLNPPQERSISSPATPLGSSDHIVSGNMSTTNYVASALEKSQRSSLMAERLKQIRAAGKATEAAYTLDTHMSDVGIPTIADQPPSKPANMIRATGSDHIESSKNGLSPTLAKPDGRGVAAKLYATLNDQQCRSNSIRSQREQAVSRRSPTPRQSPTSRRSSTPKPQVQMTQQPQVHMTQQPQMHTTQQPQMHTTPQPQVHTTPQPQARTTPEYQSRYAIRPPSAPVGPPLAVRSSSIGQRTFSGRNHLSRHQEPPTASKSTILKPLGFDKNEHIIPLAMNMRVRNQYISIINIYRDAIMKFMESNSQEDHPMDEITKMLTRISGVLQHSDLDAEEARDHSSQPSPEDEATWAEQCSFKFCFLRHFLDQIRSTDMHVSIVAQPGRLLDMLEMFLVGRGIVYFRPDGKGSSHPGDQRFAQCRCQVSIVPSGPTGRSLAVKPATLVIAFDSSVSALEPQVQRMRGPGMHQGQYSLQPIVRLVIYKSAEHLTICLPYEIEQSDRLRRIVSGMTQLRHQAGILDPGEMEVSAAAEEVAIALSFGGHPGRWTLPSVRPLYLEFHDSSRSSSTQEGSQLSQEPELVFESSTLKRAWESTDSAVSDRNKRQRMSPVEGNAHVPNSMGESQRVTNLVKRNADLNTEIENLKTRVAQLDRLTASHKSLEAQIATLTRQNKSLLSESSSIKTNHQTHLSDLEASLSSLQTRYESKNRAHQTLHIKTSELETSLAVALEKQSAQSIEIASLRTAKRQLEIDLEQTRKDMLTTPHENPDITRITVAESHARDARAANETLTKKVASLTSDLEFTRGEYQTASTSAADLASQVDLLTNELENATRRANGEAARLAAINRDTAVKDARKEVRQLKAMMEERERLCRRKEEEIEMLKGRRGRAGGVVTRGGSVQPGMGAQGKSPRGSRGGSPLGGVAGVGGEGMRRGGSGLRGEVV